MSLRMAKALGLTELYESLLSHGMADRRRVSLIGYAKAITINLQGVTIVTNVVIFDQNDYDFLISRKALHKFSLYTNWSTYNWLLKKKNGSIEPLSVSYISGLKKQKLKVLDPVSDLSSEGEMLYQ